MKHGGILARVLSVSLILSKLTAARSMTVYWRPLNALAYAAQLATKLPPIVTVDLQLAGCGPVLRKHQTCAVPLDAARLARAPHNTSGASFQ